PLYIVGFKQGRTDLFFRPLDSTSRGSETIRIDDLVIVEADRGKDIGRVVNDSITVDQVGSFLSSQGAGPSSSGHPASGKSNTPATRSSINPKRLYSKASLADTSLLASKASDEEKALMMCIQKVQQRNLPMRVISAELQWDRRKLTFYYIAGSRVDFRALVADLFKIWKVRIYMSQIPGPDQE
ncbi:PSP1-domain-containing protein, partial [Microstroma glucosiphilum]